MTATIFDNLIYGYVLQSCVGGEDMTVACLAHPRRTSDYDVGLYSRHICCVYRVKINLKIDKDLCSQ